MRWPGAAWWGLVGVWLLGAGLTGCANHPAAATEAPDNDTLTVRAQASPILVAEGDLGLRGVVGDQGIPRVRQQHIFFGEVNHAGEAVGFHYRPTGEQAGLARLVPGSRTAADAHGVYEARVELKSPDSGQWIAKTTPSSFYPDQWTPVQVLSEIRSAYEHRSDPEMVHTDKWDGISKSGVHIVGYLAVDRSILTAYPVIDHR